jgi:hypothetical protein
MVRPVAGRPLVAALALACAAPAAAEDAAAERALTIELNAVSQQGDACRLVFLAENGLGTDLASAVFETVLFDREGQVVTLTLFDFQGLPVGRPRVRQFDLPATDCAALGRILLNDASACEGEGLDADTCMDALRWRSRTEIEAIG